MFNKQGAPQPMTLVNKCHICGCAATTVKDGKLYCSACANPAAEVNAVDGTEAVTQIG